MKTILRDDFLKWVFSQDRDRSVNMGSYKRSKDCGCLMVQYGEEIKLEFDSCDDNRWWLNDEIVAEFKVEEYYEVRILPYFGRIFNLFNVLRNGKDRDSVRKSSEEVMKFRGTFGELRSMMYPSYIKHYQL